VRLLNNPFYQKVLKSEEKGASADKLKELLGKGRAKSGMFEGDINEGELEVGQVSAMIDKIKPVADIIDELVNGYKTALQKLNENNIEK
jgi:enoyl-[acyl-carrier protein] reductase II